MKPLLKWPGGKTKLLPKLRPFFPRGWRQLKYVDPFFGGGALLFALRPHKAYLSDINADLIGTYQAVRDQLEAVAHELAFLARNDSESFFFATRALFNQRKYPFPSVRAAQMIYLNKTCFNGLWRVNASGEFNVSYGHYKAPTIPSLEELRAVSAFLQPYTFLPRPFDKALSAHGDGTFVYLDPPYDDNFTAYSGPFSKREQTLLKECVDKLTAQGAKVMLSNNDTDFIRALYAKYRIETVSAPRSISADGALRGLAQEVVVMNYGD